MELVGIIIGFVVFVLVAFWLFDEILEYFKKSVSSRTFYIVSTMWTIVAFGFIGAMVYHGVSILEFVILAILAIALSLIIKALKWGGVMIANRFLKGVKENAPTLSSGAHEANADQTPSPMKENTGWEGAAATIDELFHAALRADKYSELDALIGQVCALRRFAPWNAFLIAAQRPGALAVASPREWKREFRRKVIPGARPIVILQPFGPVAFVYELKDTVGEADPRLEAADPFAVKETGPIRISKNDVGAIASRSLREYRIEIRYDDLGGASAGSALGLEKLSKAEVTLGAERHVAFLIRLAHWQSPPASLMTLFHELGHIYCGHQGAPLVHDPKSGKDRLPKWRGREGFLNKGQREFEAEATAYIVARRIRLETKSAEYLASYVNKEDADGISVFAIVNAASRIENLLPRRLVPNRRQI